ncbi:MAG: MnhB domain-containing protein [Methanimicrococcus sp.]|nr:MnhB domain-containing protein [Methanimicrococcus sp.]
MSTIIAKTISRAVLIIAMLFSIYLLLNGANFPGGGFVGGVLFVCSISLVYITYGMKYINNRLKQNWLNWVAYGLLFASLTAITPMIVNHNYFRSAFDHYHLEVFGLHIGHLELLSTMFFDIGVYFTVIGALLFILTGIASDKATESIDTDSPDFKEAEEYSLKPQLLVQPPKPEERK